MNNNEMTITLTRSEVTDLYNALIVAGSAYGSGKKWSALREKVKTQLHAFDEQIESGDEQIESEDDKRRASYDSQKFDYLAREIVSRTEQFLEAPEQDDLFEFGTTMMVVRIMGVFFARDVHAFIADCRTQILDAKYFGKTPEKKIIALATLTETIKKEAI